MARRISTARKTVLAGTFGAGLAVGLIGLGLAQAQAQVPPPAGAPGTVPAPFSRSCQTGANAVPVADELPLPNVANALADRKSLRILAMGAAPGRIGARGGGYTAAIEAMLSRALRGIEVVVTNRGVSGELATDAALRMKNEVALDEPDLVLWQVGTNDALAYVPVAEFTATIKDQIAWLKFHKVDVVLVGLQFASHMQRDAYYAEIRDALRKLAAEENVVVVRFYEAMQMLNAVPAGESEPVLEEFDRNDADYDCLAQYVARAITLGVFARRMPLRAVPR